MLLEIQNITAGYGDIEVLHSISLKVEKGEIVSVIGPNGAGKTTLLKTIIGLVRPLSGKILFENREISGIPTERIAKLGIAYCPQGKALHPDMTVIENLKVGSHVLGNEEKANDRMQRVVELFPKLKELKDRKAGVLSGGERQIVALARAFILEPKLHTLG